MGVRLETTSLQALSVCMLSLVPSLPDLFQRKQIGEAEQIGEAGDEAMYAYEPYSNSWKAISEMSVERYQCFAVTLPSANKLMVVGGSSWSTNIDSVEFASLL